jgi:hypothetical protein
MLKIFEESTVRSLLGGGLVFEAYKQMRSNKSFQIKQLK